VSWLLKHAISVLKVLNEAQCCPAVLYAHSRGGATLKKIIGILNKPTDDDQKILDSLEITKINQNTILNAIKMVYVLNPLTDTRVALKKQAHSRLALLYYIAPKFVDDTIIPWFAISVLPRISQFNPADIKQPMDYINQWSGLESHVLLHFEENDNDVSNDTDIECAKLFIQNVANLSITRTNNGGHNAYTLLISKIIHWLNHQAKCSYLDSEECLSISAKTIVVDTQFFKNYFNNENDNIEGYLNEFSKTYTINKKSYKKLYALFFISLIAAYYAYTHHNPTPLTA
jgi:hypothetical protein